MLGDASYNHRLIADFISLLELFNRKIVNVNTLDVVDKVRPDFKHFLLLEKVAVLRPLTQEQVGAMLGLHKVHFLFKLVAHHAC